MRDENRKWFLRAKKERIVEIYKCSDDWVILFLVKIIQLFERICIPSLKTRFNESFGSFKRTMHLCKLRFFSFRVCIHSHLTFIKTFNIRSRR